MTAWWQRAVRLAVRMAVAFGLSVVAAIFVGAAVTDNALAQIAVTVLAAVGLWLPVFFMIVGVERLFARGASPRSGGSGRVSGSRVPTPETWRRLAAAAPGQSERIAVLQRSLSRSRQALGSADLDPDAHDLCVLIDRRLPELIDRELDNLPPDDRGRRQQIGELVELVEQFARHCSRKRSDEHGVSGYEAEVLRRRFEDRLSEDWHR